MNVFDKTIEIIEDLGWVRHNLQTTKGVCIAGAFNLAISKGRSSGPPMNLELHPGWQLLSKLVRARSPLAGISMCAPVSWNDYFASNKEHVIALLTEASIEYNEMYPDAVDDADDEAVQEAVERTVKAIEEFTKAEANAIANANKMIAKHEAKRKEQVLVSV